jgi:hypothetical protein
MGALVDFRQGRTKATEWIANIFTFGNWGEITEEDYKRQLAALSDD